MVFLPDDILYDILDLMSIKDILTLKNTNKKLKNIIDSQTFWKSRCKKDYKYIFKNNNKEVIYRDLYIKFYNKYCVCCNNQTRQRDLFYNNRVCKKCQKNVYKYICITKNQCKNVYNLTEKQISNINHKIFKNKYKMFLKKDIINYISKFNLKETLLKKKYKQSITKFNKNILRIFKLNILICFLKFNFNINISDYIIYINNYDTDNLLKKYLGNLNVNKQNPYFTFNLIYIFLQMDYLKKFNYDISILNTHNFLDCVLYILINDLDNLDTSSVTYLENIKKEVYINNSEKFIRKEKIKKYTDNVSNNILQDYIYYGGNIFNVLDDYNEFIFINKHFDLNSFYIYCLNNTSSLYILLSINIQNYCDIFGYSEVPNCVLKKYGIYVK